jgi:hypothetical protein
LLLSSAEDLRSGLPRLQFMSAGLPRCAVPTSIHCDHLIRAHHGAASDLQVTNLYISSVSALIVFPGFYPRQPGSF